MASAVKIVLQQAESGEWRASIDQGNTQTAVFDKDAGEAVERLMRFRRG